MAQTIEELMANGYSQKSAVATRRAQMEKERNKKNDDSTKELGDTMGAVRDLKKNASARAKAVDEILSWN